MIFYMVFDMIENRLNPAGWVKNVVLLDIVVYSILLLIFSNLWFIGYTFVVLITGTIVSYLIYEKSVKRQDTPWRRPAEILVTADVGINAIFCIVITAAMIIGVVIAA